MAPFEHRRITGNGAAQEGLAGAGGQPTISLTQRADALNRAAEQLIAAITKQTQGVLVALDDAALRVEQQDRLRRVLDQCSVARLGLTPRTDVLDQQQEQRLPATTTAHGAQADTGEDHQTIGTQKALVHLEAIAATQQHLLHMGLLDRQIVRVRQLLPTAGEQCVSTAAEDAAQLLVDLLPAKALGGQCHADQRRLEEQAQPLVTLAQLRLGAFALADVLHHAIDAHQATVLIALGHATQAHQASAQTRGQAHLDIQIIHPAQGCLQGLHDQRLARRVEVMQRLLEIRRPKMNVAFDDAVAAIAPEHAVVADLQHPAAQVGDVFGLAEQMALTQ